MQEVHDETAALKTEDADRPVVLSVTNVKKSFKLPIERPNGLKQAMINRVRGIKGFREQKVLKDISFEVQQGDFFGIVGRNGSGKSTLLKLISQIYYPDAGSVEVTGRLVPFIELGVGFNPELTGRENVYLNGALLGFSRKEIDGMYDEIVAFAELEEFMDQKLKNYSSGMQVRLAFSVAIKAQGDILVLDEVLAVGDESFQRKCDKFFTEVKKDKTKTVILVTHSMDSVRKYCNKAILISKGYVKAAGDKNEVAEEYILENLQTERPAEDQVEQTQYAPGLCAEVPYFQIVSNGPLIISDQNDFDFQIDYEYLGTAPYNIYLQLLDIRRGGTVYDSCLADNRENTGKQTLCVQIPTHLFNDGEYRLAARLEVLDTSAGDGPGREIAFTNDHSIVEYSIKRRVPDRYRSSGLLTSQALPVTLREPAE